MPTPATSREALLNAAKLLNLGEYESAAAAYSAVATVNTDPDTRAQAWLGAAIAINASGDVPTAVAFLQQAVKSAPAGSATLRQASYLLGSRLNDASRPGDAVKVLAPLAAGAVTDVLTPYILVAYASALEASGDAVQASAEWDKVLALPGIDSSLQLTVYQARASSARASADTASLEKWLASLINVTGDPALRYELAGLYRSDGNEAGFAAQLRAIVANSPSSAQALPAVADLHAAELDVDPGDEGLVDYRQGHLADAQAILTQAIAEPGIAPSDLAYRMFYLAAAYDDAGDVTDGVKYYDATAAIPTDSVYVQRAEYWAARAIEGTGDAEDASARYVDLVTNGPDGEFTAEAAFRAGYVLLNAGDPAGAAAAWQNVSATNDARLLYWKGRAQDLSADPAGAKTAYTAAQHADPLGFYGQAAARKLGTGGNVSVGYQPRNLDQPPNWSAIGTWLNSVVPGTLPGTPPTAAAELVNLGMRDQAATVLLDAATGAGAWRLLELAKEASDAGLVDIAAQLAVKLDGVTKTPWSAVPKDLLRAAYPLDYTGQLDADSKANNLDPLFVAAVVRQESYWDAGAGSYAGALGLMQVIPETGAAIASDLDVSAFEANDLYRPAVSLQFGTYYLAEQLNAFGDPAAALAAYNAGPGSAQEWQAAASGSDPADFLEQVDIAQTQDYVEQIFEHYAAYKLAYGGS
ncbi:MAG: transglycosylase SLT domain-containing protein [Tepidiformaceae bacterium]